MAACDKLAVLGKYIKKGLKIVSRPFIVAAKFVFKIILLQIYKIYLFIKKRVQIFYQPAKSRVFSFFSKKYLIHFAIILISFLVAVNSISAKEIRDDSFGEDTVIYGMYNEKTLGNIEEEVKSVPQNKVLSYLDKAGVSSRTPSSVGDMDENITEDQIADSLTTITQGGAALVKPNMTETKIATRPREDTTAYAVQSGDTLSTIAEKFNVSTLTILWANNLSETSLIKPGDTLNILPVSGVAHKIKSGDTVSTLAKTYGVGEDKIIEFNKLADASDIQVGQDLIVPGGTMPAPVRYASTRNPSNVNIAPIKNLVAPPNAPSIPGGKMVWPTNGYRITQYYSWRHKGLDIDGDYSSPLYAAEAGKIVKCGWGTGYGNVIYIDHGNGVQTRYAHMSKFFVANGQYVTKGQTLGMMGTTGWSTGTHIHFEVRIGGVPMNPLSYIK